MNPIKSAAAISEDAIDAGVCGSGDGPGAPCGVGGRVFMFVEPLSSVFVYCICSSKNFQVLDK